MNKLARLFIRASLVYLALIAILGVLIIIGPGYSFMHSHFALIGWVSFMLFGLAYESIPRFTRRALYSRKLGFVHFWLANIGLIGLSLSYPFMRMYMLKGKNYSDTITVVMIFGLIEAVSYFIFIYNIWKSMGNTGSSE